MEIQKQGYKTETFLVTVNEFGQRIYTSQTNPYKSYIIDEHGTMVEYIPNYASSESNGDTNDSEIPQSLEENSRELEAQMDMMSPIEQDFEDSLMNELDSGIMGMTPYVRPEYLMEHMNIVEPLTKLRTLIEERIGISLKNYKFLLQGNQELESHRNLTEQCVQGEGLVQINFQVLVAKKAINIIDVLKPAEDFFHDDDSEKSSRETEDEDNPKNEGIVQWHVDINFQNEIERLKMPHDPMNWNVIHVRHWLQWAVRQFNLPNIKLSDWSMNGEKLYELTLAEFQKLVPSDPGGIFWAHFELLRKMKVIAVRNEDNCSAPVKRKPKLMEQSKTTKGKQNFCTSTPIKYFDHSLPSRNHYNGQIQLWQFLLELLTTTDYKTIIQWIGTDGEFKLINPEAVAHLWGERKNKPKMNYEKLSRALRYYYDGDMISKVHGKRFVYKFVCDLRQLIGYTPMELSNLVTYGNPKKILM